MKKLVVIPLFVAGMAAMVGCGHAPVEKEVENKAIDFANLD